MLLFIKCIIVLMIGLFISLITGLILLPLLKEKNMRQSLSIYLERTHENKKDVPTFGGLIFILPTILIIFFLLLLNKIEMTYNLFIC